MCPSLTPKSKKERPQESFQLIATSDLSNIYLTSLKIFQMLSMTFLASFLKTETLVIENYCRNIIWGKKVNFRYLESRRQVMKFEKQNNHVVRVML